MKNLYFDDLVRFTTYLRRYHVGKGRMVAVTEGPGCLVAGGQTVHLANKPNLVYRFTIYEEIITGKLRRAIRIVEVDLGLYRSLCYHVDVEDGFYFGQLDSLVYTLVGRRRKLLALQAVINAD